MRKLHICKLESKCLELSDSRFTGNRICDSVVRVHTNRLYVVNTQFVSNYCTALQIENFDSMESYAETNIAHINDSTFIGNHGRRGGGIKSITFSKILTITNCNFSANHADELGGAINTWNEIIISDSTFTNNSASLGGAIFFDGCFSIEKCMFTSNYLTSKMYMYERTGSVIFTKFENGKHQ